MDLLLYNYDWFIDHICHFAGITRFQYKSAASKSQVYYKSKYSVIKDKAQLTHCPINMLRKIQRILKRDVFSIFPINEAACGFVRGGSNIKHVKNHVNCRSIFIGDFVDFFGSVDISLFDALCKENNVEKKIARNLRHLCFLKDNETGRFIFPKGAITSPILSNAMMYPVDCAIQRLAKKYDFIYSRFVDDIAISTDKITQSYVLDQIKTEILALFFSYGFRLHKVYVGPIKSDLEITGIHIKDRRLVLAEKFHARSAYLERTAPANDPRILSSKTYIEQVERKGNEKA